MVYIDFKIGKHGEIVIPAIVRKRYKIRPGQKIKGNITETKIELLLQGEEVLAMFDSIAAKEGVPANKLIYGDKLYEEVFK